MKKFGREDVAAGAAIQQTEKLIADGFANVEQQAAISSVPTAEDPSWEAEAHIGCSGKIPMSLYARTQSYRVAHKMSLTAQINVALDYWLRSQQA